MTMTPTLTCSGAHRFEVLKTGFGMDEEGGAAIPGSALLTMICKLIMLLVE